MSDPKSISPPESLEQLTVGVVLGGRYSLKDRVPRWIAERRFRAHDLESGDSIAMLVWSAETPWFEELVRQLEALPEPIHREAGVRQGYGIVVTNWVDGMRSLRGEAGSAAEALALIQASLPSTKRTVLPPRRDRVAEPERPVTARNGEATPPEAAPVTVRSSRLEWAGFALAAVVAAVVVIFTVQLIRSLSAPIIVERKITVKAAAPSPTPVTAEGRLKEVAMLRKNGSATAALRQLIQLRAQFPQDPQITDEINGLLDSLQSDLPAIKAGLRPALRQAIDQLAAEGNPAAVRLSPLLTAPEPPATNSPEPLPIR